MDGRIGDDDMLEVMSSDDRRGAMRELFNSIYSFYSVKVLGTALKLGVFEALAEKPSSVEALAERTNAKPRGVGAILLGLLTLRLVKEDAGVYSLTSLGESTFLRRSTEYLGGMVEFAEWQFDALPRLEDAVRTDTIVWEGFSHYIEGVQGVDHAEAKARQDRFNEGLAAGAEGTAKAVMAKLRFEGTKRLLDVGGNLGVFAATILKEYPDMRATVFDLPQVAEQVNDDVRHLGMGERLDAIGGDFTADTLPLGYDLISFIRIFNSRTEETCIALLRKAYDALPAGGRCLFYEEHVLPENPNEFPPGALWGAMFMLISSPGELRKLSRWEELFRIAGFTNVRGVRGKQSGIVIGEKAG